MVSLSVKYGIVFSPRPKLAEIVRAVANAHLWPHTRTAYVTDPSSDIIILQQKST